MKTKHCLTYPAISDWVLSFRRHFYQSHLRPRFVVSSTKIYHFHCCSHNADENSLNYPQCCHHYDEISFIFVNSHFRVCLLLTEERVKSNALVCIAYGHVKLHQLGIACCAVTVQLSVWRVSFTSFSVELNGSRIITCKHTTSLHTMAWLKMLF